MKTLIAFLLLINSACFAQQYKKYLSAGVTASESISFGYYAGGSLEGIQNSVVSYRFDGQVIRESADDVNLTSLNGTFSFKFRLFESPVSLSIGPRFGYALNNVAEDKFKEDRAMLKGVAGCYYDLGRFELAARLNKSIRSNDKIDSFHVGVGYVFK